MLLQFVTNLTDDVRSIQGNERIDYGKLDHQVVGASSVGRPSCNPSWRRDCKHRWDLHEVKRLLVE